MTTKIYDISKLDDKALDMFLSAKIGQTFDPLDVLLNGAHYFNTRDEAFAHALEWTYERAIHGEPVERHEHPADENCPKCNGLGFIDGYKHIEGGVCFRCGGTGWKYSG